MKRESGTNIERDEDLGLPIAPYLAFLDLEFTCSQEGSENPIPRSEMEVVEIGVVVLEGHGLQEVAEHSTFCRPMLHPTLTPFCIELLAISQADVDTAPQASRALSGLTDFLSEFDGVRLVSWGGDCLPALRQIADNANTDFPYTTCFDLKRAFASQRRIKRVGLKKALEICGLPLPSIRHRALADAKSTANLFRFLAG